MQGTLELKEAKKKTALFTKYTSAYLTLNATGIAIYRDATLKHALSSYPLRCVDHIGISVKKKRKFVIHIRESYNTQATLKLGFRAPHVIVAEAWVASLQKALTEYKLNAKANRAESLLMPATVTSTGTGMKRSESMLTPKAIRNAPPPPAHSTGKLFAEKQNQTLEQLLLDTMMEHGSLVGADLLMRDPGMCLRLMLTAQHKFLQATEANTAGKHRTRVDIRASLDRLDLAADMEVLAIQAERDLNEQHAKDTRILHLKRKRVIQRLDELGVDWDMNFVDTLIKSERALANPPKYTAPHEVLTPKSPYQAAGQQSFSFESIARCSQDSKAPSRTGSGFSPTAATATETTPTKHTPPSILRPGSGRAPPPPPPRTSYHDIATLQDSPPPTPLASEARPTHSRSRTLPRLDDATLLKPSMHMRITCTAKGCFSEVEGWQRFKASLQSAKAAGHFCPVHQKQIEEARQRCLLYLTIDAVTTKHGPTFVGVLKQMVQQRAELRPPLLRVLWVALNSLYPPELVSETTSLRTRRRVTLTKMRARDDRKEEAKDLVLVNSLLAVDHFSDTTVKHCGGICLTEQINHALFAILLNSNFGITETTSDPTPISLRTPAANPSTWLVILATAIRSQFELRGKILFDTMSLLIQNDFNCLSVVNQEGWQSTFIALLFDSPLIDWVDKDAQDSIKSMHNFWLNVFMMLHVYTFKHVGERADLNFGPTIRTTFATLGKMCEPNVKRDLFIRYFFAALLSKIHGEGIFCHGSLGAQCFVNLHALSELCAQFISTSHFLEQFSPKGALVHRLVKLAFNLREARESRSPMPNSPASSESKESPPASSPVGSPTSSPSGSACSSPELRARRGLSLDAGKSTPMIFVGQKLPKRLSFGSVADTSKSTNDLSALLEPTVGGGDGLLRSLFLTRPSCLFKPFEVDQKAISVSKTSSLAKIEVACECGAMVSVNLPSCPKCGSRVARRLKKLAMDRGDIAEREKKMAAILRQKYLALQKRAKECRVDADALLGAAEPTLPTPFVLDARERDCEDKPSEVLYSLHLRSASALWTTHYGPPTEECEDTLLVDKLLEIYKDAQVANYSAALHPNFTEQEKAMYETAHADYLLWVNVRELLTVLNELEPHSLEPAMTIEFLQKFWLGAYKERTSLLNKFSKAVKEKA